MFFGVLNFIVYLLGFIYGLFFLFCAFVGFVFPHIPSNYTYAIAFLIPGVTLVIPTNLLTRNKSKLKLLKIIKIVIIATCLDSFLIISSKISDASQLVENCTGREICPGRVEALETLVKYYETLEGINLSGANLQGVNLSNAWFNDKYGTPADFSDADLRGSNLSNANLQEAYFHDSNLSNANLSDAFISSANLSNANLSNANFTNTYLRYADLANANLSGANLYNAKLAHIENLTPSQIKSACNWEKAIYFDGYDEDDQQILRIKQLKVDKNSDPEKPVDCSRWQQQSKHWLKKLLDFSR